MVFTDESMDKVAFEYHWKLTSNKPSFATQFE
jgi:hypothetical protein